MNISKQLFLNSNDATLLGNTYLWTLQDVIVCPPGQRFQLALVSAEIPFSFYSTNESNNYMRVNGQTITVQPGNYSVKQLLAKLREMLGIETSYDLVYNKCTLTFPTTVVLEDPDSTGNSLLKSLGFQNGYYTGTTFTSDSVVNLLGISAIYIRSNFATLNIDSRSRSSSSVLSKIPANSTSAGIISFIDRSGFKSTLYDSFISSIAIDLTNEHGENIDLNKQPFQLTIQVETTPERAAVGWAHYREQ